MDNYSYTRVKQKKKSILQHILLLRDYNKGAFLRLYLNPQSHAVQGSIINWVNIIRIKT